jgi:hypothetical protein
VLIIEPRSHRQVEIDTFKRILQLI